MIVVSWSSTKLDKIFSALATLKQNLSLKLSWWCFVIEELNDICGWVKKSLPSMINCDNLSAVAFTENPNSHAWTKHIEIQHLFIQDHVEKVKIKAKVLCNQNIVGWCTYQGVSKAKHVWCTFLSWGWRMASVIRDKHKKGMWYEVTLLEILNHVATIKQKEEEENSRGRHATSSSGSLK